MGISPVDGSGVVTTVDPVDPSTIDGNTPVDLYGSGFDATPSPDVTSLGSSSTDPSRAAILSLLGPGQTPPAYLDLIPPGWKPGDPIALPKDGFSVSEQKRVMAQTAVESAYEQHQGSLPTDDFMNNAYAYWMPKFDTTGGKGLDGYWLGRLLEPPGDGGGTSGTSSIEMDAGDDLMLDIQQILAGQESDDDKTKAIKDLLTQHGLPAGNLPSVNLLPAGGLTTIRG
jgi:hypothetical protein